mgnify:FL=1|tara:strand:+ start:284 stop:994 length:711 start_codon:yes stop_codon:yes gene_type:complete
MEGVDANNVIFQVNKMIKFKDSARKSYIRKKLLQKDLKDDITQLCFCLYDAVVNKVVVVNDNQENIKNQRLLLSMDKEIIKLNKENELFQEKIRLLKVSNDSLRDNKSFDTFDNGENNELLDEYKEKNNILYDKIEKLKSELKFKDQDLYERNNIITKLNMDKRHYKNNIRPDDEKDIEIKELKERIKDANDMMNLLYKNNIEELKTEQEQKDIDRKEKKRIENQAYRNKKKLSHN